MQDVQFEELFSIDSDSLRAVAPVHAVIFLFKYSNIDREYAKRNEPIDGVYDEDFHDNGVFFANQTIQNACATQAVLNSLLNKTDAINIGNELSNLHSFVREFDPEMAGETLSNSEEIRKVHNSFSAPKFIDKDDSIPPDPSDDKDDGLFHFITYVNVNDVIYELDGLKQYPIVHEPLDSGDQFYDKLPEILQRRIAKYHGEIRFSLLAITNNKINQYRELGDSEALQRELQKRETWQRENILRRHDFPKLIVALLKNISKDMDDAQWNHLLQQARGKTMQRYKR